MNQEQYTVAHLSKRLESEIKKLEQELQSDLGVPIVLVAYEQNQGE